MPAIKESRFGCPGDNTSIWRYMTLSRFEDLINTSELYFNRADLFEDPFEGSLPQGEPPKRFWEDFSDYRRRYPSFGPAYREIERKGRFINCWYANEVESTAMWGLYGKTKESIAIRSTIARLDHCLTEDFRLGSVRYLDWAKDWIEPGSVETYFAKRLSYSHENEVRAVKTVQTPYEILESADAPRFLRHPIDPFILIEAIYLSPNAPAHLRERVTNFLERRAFSAPIYQSTLNDKALF